MLRHVVYASLLHFGVETAVIFASVFSAATRQQLSRPGSLGALVVEPDRLENRLFRGKVHEVMVVPGGFLWQGEIYSSLSTIALRITGTSLSGLRFLGLRDGADPRPPSPSVPISRLPSSIEHPVGGA